MAETFSERLARLRSERKMTVTELARAVRVSEGAIRNLERGVSRGPSAVVGLRLERALGVRLAYLLFGDEGDPEETELRWHRDRLEALERQVFGKVAQGRHGNTTEAQGEGDRPRTAPE